MQKIYLGMLLGILWLSQTVSADNTRDVHATVDRFHSAAAAADMELYFGQMTRDVVFLGTDGSERWQGNEFREFVEGHFAQGQGWVYLASDRRIDFSTDQRVAWFDEALDHAKLGRCRGSGVLLLDGGVWKIAQYNLSVPIPNEMVLEVAQAIVTLGVVELPQDSKAAGARAADAGTAESQAATSDDSSSVNCSKKRHKTNRKAGC